MREYYDVRAPEYDDWYLGVGRFGDLDRPEWHASVRLLEQTIAALDVADTLDVACGTGYLTRHLRGTITALDQSERMLAIARERVPGARCVRGDAFALPFADASFDRIFTAHFYGHLQQDEQAVFLAEARRVAAELVVVDAAVRPDREPAEWQERVLNDGSRFPVYKRYFEADQLAAELGGGRVVHESRWFVVVASPGDRQVPDPIA